MPRSSRGMTAENAAPLPEPSATVSLCDAFPVGFKLRNELRTNRGRIADSPLSPVPFTQDVAGGLWVRTRWSFAPPHKRRFDGGFVKAGDGAESNQNRGGVKWIPGSRPPPNKMRENNPMHSRHVVEIIDLIFTKREVRSPHGAERNAGAEAKNPGLRCAPSGLRQRGYGTQPYCVFATLGGWALVMKLVASSMAGPSGVGTFSQNGTRMRVPAIGANATSMLRWAARYLITGRSGM
jgi:hypothetical protein